MKINKKILLGLTTTPGSDWREKAKEIDFLGLSEVALFPTFLLINDRRELYALLEKTGLQKIPHVHLRDDIEDWEVDYFLQRWKTQVFNIHARKEFLRLASNSKIKGRVFVENSDRIDSDFKELLSKSAGLCVDFSHWKARWKNKRKGYVGFENFFEKHLIGCCHISAVKKRWGFFWEDEHFMENLSDLDYMQNFVQYLPEIASLELENSFFQQLEAKKYLEKMVFSSPALEK